MTKNCVLVGYNAGSELPDGSEGLVIIGDNVTSLDQSQDNVMFLGSTVAIGETVFGRECNLKEIISEWFMGLKESSKTEEDFKNIISGYIKKD